MNDADKSAEVERLRAALEWYADEEHYRTSNAAERRYMTEQAREALKGGGK